MSSEMSESLLVSLFEGNRRIECTRIESRASRRRERERLHRIVSISQNVILMMTAVQNRETVATASVQYRIVLVMLRY